MGSEDRETLAILLLDDSAAVREALRVALASEGYRMIEAADGREDVRLYAEHHLPQFAAPSVITQHSVRQSR